MGRPFTPGSWEEDVRASLLACTTKKEIDAVTAVLLKEYIGAYQQYSVRVQSHYAKAKLRGLSALATAKEFNPEDYEKAFEPVELTWDQKIAKAIRDAIKDALKEGRWWAIVVLIALALVLGITVALIFVF